MDLQSKIGGYFGICQKCNVSPCECWPKHAASAAASQTATAAESSQTLKASTSGGSISALTIGASASISSASITGSSISISDVINQVRLEAKKSQPRPEPKDEFVPSWDREEEDMQTTPAIPDTLKQANNDELVYAIDVVREAIAKEVHDYILVNDFEQAKDIMNMSVAELVERYAEGIPE